MTTRLTSWTLIHAAGAGEQTAREEFARRYAPVMRAFFGARWRSPGFALDIEDCVQEVLLRCVGEESPLGRAEPGRPGGFRKYLAGICRMVAREHEARRRRERGQAASRPPELDELAGDEATLTRVFDAAFAGQVMAEARRLHRDSAERAGPDALRRYELLRARFEDGLAIRHIAAQWGVPADGLHHDYAKAREEFHAALIEAVTFHCPDATRAELEAEAQDLLTALGATRE